MNALVKIEARELAGITVQTCNARDLWQFVESKTQFADWIKGRIEKYGFVEGEDWVVQKIVNNPAGGRPTLDYHLTIETAKELAMVENNDKGRQIRRYFIECERRAKAAPATDPMAVLSDPAAMRGLLLTYTEKVIALETTVAEQAPKVEALDRIATADGRRQHLHQHGGKALAGSSEGCVLYCSAADGFSSGTAAALGLAIRTRFSRGCWK